VDKYLSPVSGRRTTMVLPLFSGRFAICVAAKRAAPEEIPTKSPSDFATSLAVWNASSFFTLNISSEISLLKIFTKKRIYPKIQDKFLSIIVDGQSRPPNFYFPPY
jgi:hypothetical protein